MSVFGEKEIAYMQGQRLGRLATVNPQGKPQIAPVGFRYNPDLDVIEIGGRAMSKTKKFRNVQENPNVAFVIDDVLPPWQPRGIEIRGTAETAPSGGKEIFGDHYQADEAVIRIKPRQIISWGLEENGLRSNRKAA